MGCCSLQWCWVGDDGDVSRHRDGESTVATMSALYDLCRQLEVSTLPLASIYNQRCPPRSKRAMADSSVGRGQRRRAVRTRRCGTAVVSVRLQCRPRPGNGQEELRTLQTRGYCGPPTPCQMIFHGKLVLEEPQQDTSQLAKPCARHAGSKEVHDIPSPDQLPCIANPSQRTRQRRHRQPPTGGGGPDLKCCIFIVSAIWTRASGKGGAKAREL